MRKIFIIVRREYLERVRTKSFVVMTLLIPALMFALSVLPGLMMARGSGGTKHLVVVASDATTGELIRRHLEQLSDKEVRQRPGQTSMDKHRIGVLTVDVDTNTSDTERSALTAKVERRQLDGVIFATNDALAAKKVSFITPIVSSILTNAEFEKSLNEAVQRDLLKSKGMSDDEIEKALQPISLEAQSPSGTANPQLVFITVFSMVMILYITVLLYGVNVMRAILEEKTSRIMEVMLSTAQASELMAGKILGVAAVGLTQICIWAAIVIVPATGVAAGLGVGNILSPRLLIYFAVFYLLGFALYSTLCAAVGAMVNSEQEAQQLQFLVMLPMIVAVIIMAGAIENPDSSAAVWGSIFPLTAPLIMFLRVALQSPPDWQVALSIVLMIATVFALVWVCARIYRVGILMYGKRPTLPELMKWIRYA